MVQKAKESTVIVRDVSKKRWCEILERNLPQTAQKRVFMGK